MSEWLTIRRGKAPLIVSIPHSGTDIPSDIADSLVSLPLARHDADLHVHELYAFAEELDATIIRTAISRTVIDVNRDPSGLSLYPGQTTTGLCPTETFDGVPLYRQDHEPDDSEIARRRDLYFAPYHDALEAEIFQLREAHPRIVLYDAHSIRSLVPRLFDGELPQFNIGTNSAASCDPILAEEVVDASIINAPDFGQWGAVVDGRFKGGWITRHYGAPEKGVHAIQMELAMRAYLDESLDWPPPYDPEYAADVQVSLRAVLTACIAFARKRNDPPRQ